MLSTQVFTVIFGFSLNAMFKSPRFTLNDLFLVMFKGSVDANC